MKPFAYSTLLIALAIAIAAAVFTVQNDAELTVYFVNWEAESSTAIVVLGAFAAGVAAASLALLPTILKSIGNAANARREAQRLQRELQNRQAPPPAVTTPEKKESART
jgi:uncharacterized integral membrane protein